MRCIPLAEPACLPLPPCIQLYVNLFGSQKCEGGINQIYYVAAIAGGKKREGLKLLGQDFSVPRGAARMAVAARVRNYCALSTDSTPTAMICSPLTNVRCQACLIL